MTHTWSLLSEGHRATHRPLAQYISPSKKITHANLNVFSESLTKSYRLSFARSDGLVEFFDTDGVSYMWVKRGNGSTDLLFGSVHDSTGAVTYAGVAAHVTTSIVTHPLNGSPLWDVFVDTAKISPVLALMSYFATSQMYWNSYVTCNLVGKVPRPPKILGVMFDDEYTRVHAPPHDPGIAGKLQDSGVMRARVFDSRKLAAYNLSEASLRKLNVQAVAALVDLRERFFFREQ